MSLREVAFITVFAGFDGFGGSGEPLCPPFACPTKYEKPRIRLGCPSRSTFSQAPRKLLLVDFGRKEYGYRTSGRGLTVLQEPALTVLLVLPNKIQDKEATVTVLAVSAVMAVSVVTAPQYKANTCSQKILAN